MKIIGITGGVGAGKSRILSILKDDYQAEIIQADEVAKELEEQGAEGYRQLVEIFGTDILDRDGRIDRGRFASLIFQNEEALRKVNTIIHPLTWEEMRRRAAASTAWLVAIEAALFDENSKSLCEELWFVDTSEEKRISRLMANRGYSRQKCLDIIANQKDRNCFLKLADVVIDNNGSIEQVRKQIAGILGRTADEIKGTIV
ncbi:MAG: dephospho-CoA kinase [Brotaphodocola sp.]